MATIFVSCGQFTATERALGKQVCDLIRTFHYDPYFAENQSNLRGLHENILKKLNEAAGLVVIMHPRGEVQYSSAVKHQRGSVWIEQEVAIAAFMTHCLGRHIEIAAFIHEDIKREGIRDLLHLNPVPFRTDDQVLAQLPTKLSAWALAASGCQLKVSYERVRTSSERHDYRLDFFVENTGTTRLEQYQLDLLFPNVFLEQSSVHALEVTERRTKSHRLFRATEEHYPNKPIFPGDTKRIFALNYFVDDEIFKAGHVMEETFTTTLRCGQQGPAVTAVHPIKDFQIF
jgi:hypothetical protein